MATPPTPAGFAAWNDEMAQRYDPDAYHRESPLPVRLLERRRVSTLVRLLDARPGHRVLEVGVGAGNVLERVEHGQRTGIDLCEPLLEKARRRLGPDVDLRRMNAEALEFDDNAFDRVYCSEVLEHVLEPRNVVAEMRRVLAPGGVCVVSVPNEAMINRVKGAVLATPVLGRLARRGGYAMPDHMEDEWHLHEFDEAMLREVVDGIFTITDLAGVPSTRFALRWVARLIPAE